MGDRAPKSTVTELQSFHCHGVYFACSEFTLETQEKSARVSGIARDRGGAQAFVQRLVMQAVFDVLERQARSALLPDAVISANLGQLTVNVTYKPLECQGVALSLMEKGGSSLMNVYANSRRDITSIKKAELFCYRSNEKILQK
ncbi:hypothetical protein KIN20_030353 [Parelaphostrongylus tenuis]|uniref:Uncharacterized protein n=1 Tax=Parelaphostrongylus tenuis TaxID=148309 RepID=A0AAD5WGB6_PARTN|nr:hypothetical protein KIN20_030353 [Parelaphostrongylus tenuis]